MTFPQAGLIPQPYHHMMLVNRPRLAAFRHGISQVVRPGDVVLEAGAGTGVLSALAAQAGANQVYAVELNPDLAAVAARTMALNGMEDRVTVLTGRAEAVAVPGPVDVVICEMLHVGLANEQQAPVMRQIVERLAQTQDVAMLRVLPFAAVSAVQLMAVDYTYEGLHIPVVRSNNPYLEDPRLSALSDPVTYWVCRMHAPELRVDVTIPLTAACAGRVNAVQLITKAVMTEQFDHPDNDWYLFQMQFPMPERDVTEGEVVALHLAYDAGCQVEQIALSWA